MITLRPGRTAPRFQVELSPDSAASILDSASGQRHPAVSVADAHIDAAYLNDQHALRDLEEIRLHLASLAELASRPKPPTPVPPPAVSPDVVLAAAADWSAADANAAEAASARSRLATLADLRKDVASAESAAALAGAGVGAAVRALYVDGESAHRVLADTSAHVPLDQLADLVLRDPALFGDVAQTRLQRFGAVIGASAQETRAADLSAAIFAYHAAAVAPNTARDSAARALSLGPETSADTLARALDDRVALLSSAGETHPHHSLPRTAARLRALLAIADRKTRDAVLQRFPRAAPITREALSHSRPTPRERNR